MKKNIGICIVVLLFLCGCSVKYNAVIKDDLSVEENATVVETESFFDQASSKDEQIELIYSPYKQKLLNANYYVIDYRSGQYSGKHLSNSFASLADFTSRSIFYKQYWPSLNYTEDNNLTTLKTLGEFIFQNKESYEYAFVDDCEITVTLPYKVTASTADNCSIKNNNYVCIWYINANDENISFSLTFDKSIKVSDISNNDNNNNNNGTDIKNSPTSNILIMFGLILLIIVLVVIIILVVNYKEKKDLEKQERGN